VTKRRTTQDVMPDYMEDQREFFDRLVTEEWHSYQNAKWDATRNFEVQKLFEHVSPRRILDVGCGCGYHDIRMAEMDGVEEVVGIDYSARSVEAAVHAYPHPRVQRRVADIYQLAPANFDLVVSFQVIEHLWDPLQFLAACARQVKKGGYVAVVTPNRLRFANRARRLIGRPVRFSDPQHHQEFVPAELVSLARDCELTPVASFSYGLSLPIPVVRKSLAFHKLTLAAGNRMPALADCIGGIFRKAI
jgi:2-polyprenyl-3-methyl-5-hydroxy-6-metoxy-1,4-benzoquinol methylase